MQTEADFRKQAAAKLEEAKAIQEKTDAEARIATEEEAERIDSLLGEHKSLLAEADRRRRFAEAASISAAPIPAATKPIDPQEFARTPSVAAEARDLEKENQFGFQSFGEFATSVYSAHPNTRASVDPRLNILAATGLNQSVGSQGGYLVPPTFSNQIWDRLQRLSESLLARTDQYTVTGESLTFPAIAETSRAAGSRWGGIRGYWIAEAAQITSSKPTFSQVTISPKELAVLCYVTDKLLRNSPVALEQFLTRAAADEINFLIGDGIINGTGSGQPLGILNSDALISVSKETGQLAATVVFENIIKMFARMHPISRPNAVWFINQDIEPQLMALSLGVGAAGVAAYLPPGGLSGAPYATLLGKPVIPTEFNATLGTVGDIILADLSAYITGVRGGGVNASTSIHLRYDYAETAFRFLYEIDGQPWVNSAITPYKGSSNTVSPFVALATRA